MRIVIADCQSKVRNALRVLLGQQPGLEIVGEAQNSTELLALATASCPDLILLHWRLQGTTGPELLFALRRLRPRPLVLALSARTESYREAMEAGVDAFVSKMDQPERLLSAIRCLGTCVTGGPSVADSEKAGQEQPVTAPR